jgi:hypothetical protein
LLRRNGSTRATCNQIGNQIANWDRFDTANDMTVEQIAVWVKEKRSQAMCIGTNLRSTEGAPGSDAATATGSPAFPVAGESATHPWQNRGRTA